jgi:DNA-binding transcriptional MerR regulator
MSIPSNDFSSSGQMVVQLTVRDLAALVEKQVTKVLERRAELLEQRRSPRWANSLKELAEVLNVSVSTIQRWKKQGMLDEAMYQYGHTIQVDIDKARELMKTTKYIKEKKKQ